MGRHQNNGKQKTKKNEEREEGRLESAGDDLGVWVRERERERVDGVVGGGFTLLLSTILSLLSFKRRCNC